MSTINPYDWPELYDKLFLAGTVSPGVCKMSSPPQRDEGWDKQEQKGKAGGETIHNGKKLIEFEVEFELWKDDVVDCFEEWDEWKKILLTPIKKNAPRALDVYHPQLDGLDIKSVVATSWTEPVPDGKGGAKVKIKFLEYSPPKPKAAGKPKGSKAGGGSGGNGSGSEPPDPNAELKKEVAEKTEEFNNL